MKIQAIFFIVIFCTLLHDGMSSKMAECLAISDSPFQSPTDVVDRETCRQICPEKMRKLESTRLDNRHLKAKCMWDGRELYLGSSENHAEL